MCNADTRISRERMSHISSLLWRAWIHLVCHLMDDSDRDIVLH